MHRTRSVQSVISEAEARPVGRKRGVEAIFSSDPTEVAQTALSTRPHWFSRRLLADVVELSLVLIFYAAFVQDYSSNLYLRLWIHATFPWAAFLLNYYAVTTAGAVVGFLLIWLIQKQRMEALGK